MPDDIEDHTRLFAAASHPLRLRILAELSARRRSPGELAEDLGTPAYNVRQQLKNLKDGGFVEVDVTGEYRVTEAVRPVRRAAPTLFPSVFPDDD
jgi:DNA-binding transcriptional ArsR family regulator